MSQSLSHFPVINQHSQLTMRSLLGTQRKKTVHPEAGKQGYLEGDLSHGCNSQWRRRMTIKPASRDLIPLTPTVKYKYWRNIYDILVKFKNSLLLTEGFKIIMVAVANKDYPICFLFI